MPLTSVIARATGIPGPQKDAMFALHARYFRNVARAAFLRDFGEKDWVIVLRDGPEIVGFSTLQIVHLAVDGAPRVFLFSGDTIVDQAHWQHSTLAGAFGHVMLRLLGNEPGVPAHWFLIAKGYRTYRFLPVFFKTFFPVFDRATPPGHERLLRAVAAWKFGAAYDAGCGIVRHAGIGDRLRPDLCAVPAGRQDDPHVRFFLARNPGFGLGDELACIADIARSNLNRLAWRAIERTAVTWDE